ncbi:transporter substrate-binding domain-containing protein [Pseudohoeflea suaedae]|uniref:Transporter substrate-binding domain-containing protein n=1 Tax=Pseudohoeflea suaedae TaxID=877384 RepID=A0A4R5PNP3_9HYPH|nr:transporter substrate-binding domain-containing protein [Pseudohoeflea suaedae]TDH38187.1 transporter substrate-binding domain-containing protein [Pseudohoeflea suaedae]
MVPKVVNRVFTSFCNFLRVSCAILAIFVIYPEAYPVQAQDSPNYVDPRERIAAPDISRRNRIRFLTTVDFPPFNFLDQSQRLAGFNVDLARAICEVLNVVDRCQIQALPWEELDHALLNGQGEAIIAGLSQTPETLKNYRFSRPYMELPARFVVRRESGLGENVAAELSGRKVGVVKGSAHEAMLKAWFADMEEVSFDDAAAAHAALMGKEVEALYGDGVQLSFWLQSASAANCCTFYGGPYLSSYYLGEGLAIAVTPEDADLALAFDHAISVLNRNGRFAELYLRWFPKGVY